MQKTILITGCSSGIGQALAERCARAGYRLALVARRSDEFAQARAELNTARSNAGAQQTGRESRSGPNVSVSTCKRKP